MTVAHLRCFNHLEREAVARCPECARFFCRECVTEHEDRIICATCLKKFAAARSSGRHATARLVRFVQFVLGILFAWFFFFLIGATLARLPDAFHEGTLWHVPGTTQR